MSITLFQDLVEEGRRDLKVSLSFIAIILLDLKTSILIKSDLESPFNVLAIDERPPSWWSWRGITRVNSYLLCDLCYATLILLTDETTVGPRNNSLAFKGSPSIKVNILRSQMVVFNGISPLFKGCPEIKVTNLQSQWDR